MVQRLRSTGCVRRWEEIATGDRRGRNEGSKVRQRGRTLWFRRWPVVTSPVGSTAVRDGRKEDAGEVRESKREVGGGGGGGGSVGRETEPSYPRNRFSSLSTARYDCRARLPPSSSLALPPRHGT